MYDTTIVNGRRLDREEPDWAPLEKFLPPPLCGLFMWMGASRLENGTRLGHYKHSTTRSYLHLDEAGDSWEDFNDGRFRRMRHSEAIAFVFDSHWLLHNATDDERDVLRTALAAAWDRGNGDRAAGAHILPCSPASGFRTLPDAEPW